jgi:hypothetical protein
MIASSMTFDFDKHKLCCPFTQHLEEREEDIKMNNLSGSRPEINTAPFGQYLEEPQTVNEDSNTSRSQMIITKPVQEAQKPNCLCAN